MPMRPGGRPAAAIVASPPASTTAASVILIADGRAQLCEPAAAYDIYLSALLAHRRARAEASGVPWFIVTGSWGLLAPGNVLAPYPFSLSQQPVSYQRAWGRFAAEQLSLVSSVSCGELVEI